MIPRVRRALPTLTWASIVPFVAAAAVVLAAMLDSRWMPVAGALFAASLVLPPLTVRPSQLDVTRLGPDSALTRLAAFSARGTAALWVVLGAMTTRFVLSDIDPTTLGVALGLLLAAGILVASMARRLTAVSLLPVSTIKQEYPRCMARALAEIRIAIAAGVFAMALWDRQQAVAWALAVLTVVLFAAAGLEALLAVRRLKGWKARNFAALAAHEPQFAVHISGPSGSAYQVAMWLPFLERTELPFVIIVREASLFQEVSEVAAVPTVFARTLADLDQLVGLRFGTVVYVNNGVKNGHLVRRGSLHHIQLLHGESDKVSSRNPVAAMFDSLFVAGQAAVDRYWNHGIHIPAERFRIVGRPQVDGIEGPVRRAAGTPKTVLYAPTWNGFFDDADYSSLGVGVDIVEALVAAGARVIFRPHPYSASSARLQAAITEIDALLAAHAAQTGIDHLFGARATADVTTIECFNMSDAMVSDVSSVPIDYLFADKPLAIVEMHPGSLDRTPGCDTLVVGAYVVGPDADFTALADELLSLDSRAAHRERTRVYYLADFPREGYSDVFVAAVREAVATHQLPDLEDDEDDAEAFAEAEAEADGAD